VKNRRKYHCQSTNLTVAEKRRRRTGILVYFGVFIFFFIGGIRFNPMAAFIISLLDTTAVILFVSFFKYMLNVNRLRHRLLGYVITSVFVVISVIILFLLEIEIRDYFFDDRVPNMFRHAIIAKDIFLASSSLIAAFFSFADIQRKKVETLIYEKQAMELRFLKSQIKPHFIFNVLNNIYTLAYTKDDRASEAILKLADMLRYVTDECQSDTITVEKEIKYLDYYIDLHLLKTGHSEQITIEYDIDDYSVRIPPMLLQPIIENCFKHGGSDTNSKSVLFFNLTIKNQQLTFYAYNTKKKRVNKSAEDRTGVGISNIDHRLQFYFKKNYTLEIEENEDEYKLTMKFDINKMELNPKS
jgi:sensor histidine kinase YesM